MTGVLPDLMSVKASAETKYNVGDTFCVGIDEDGNILPDKDLFDENWMPNRGVIATYVCTVKPDGTIKVGFHYVCPAADIYKGDTITIPSTIDGYTVSELADWGNKKSLAYSFAKKVVIPETVETTGEGYYMDKESFT